GAFALVFLGFEVPAGQGGHLAAGDGDLAAPVSGLLVVQAEGDAEVVDRLVRLLHARDRDGHRGEGHGHGGKATLADRHETPPSRADRAKRRVEVRGGPRRHGMKGCRRGKAPETAIPRSVDEAGGRGYVCMTDAQSLVWRS